ncbi:tetratricopeptide repeat protein [Neobacillus niacini]|uniref:tetratricopeptide repeat protein n=1 Tax=Neobacillus niacini TaxID=86668 RepID=UPI0028560EB0|nr:tetratricopeptide repeat protein [Neobacillus niacini]MDR7001451.1 tetratricopeptide (TPR) repeat protein [Neobacillus niacini]
MKKRERVKRKENVIFFPGLEQRLTEKGLESLQLKKYEDAIGLLEEAKELDPENSDVLMGLVLAYFEAGAFRKAKKLASELLLKGIGDYFQMVDLYLTILIQLHEYQEIVSTIEALMDEKEIPPDKHDHFLTILQFSRRMAEQNQADVENVDPEENGPMNKSLNLFSLQNTTEQMLLLSKLAERNIRPYIEEIKDYLIAETGQSFFKTTLLTLLKEQEYDKEMEIQKFHQVIKIIPTHLPEVHTQPKMKKIIEHLEDRLENNNPVLLADIRGMVERIFFISYPFELEPENPGAWAAAFHILAEEYMGNDAEIIDRAEDYGVSSKEISLAIVKIREIEEISYPNF